MEDNKINNLKYIFSLIIVFITSVSYAGYNIGASGGGVWTLDDSTIRTTESTDKVAIGTTSSNIALTVSGTVSSSLGFSSPNFFFVGSNSVNANSVDIYSSAVTLADFYNADLGDGSFIRLYLGKNTSPTGSFLEYSKAVDGQDTDNILKFRTSSGSQLSIRGSDNFVGVNILSPDCMFEVQESDKGTGTVVMRVNYDNTGLAGSTMAQFTSFGNTVAGSIDIVDDTTLAYNTFTGSHYTKVNNRGLRKYMILESTGVVLDKFNQCVETKLSNRHKSKRVIGVYGGRAGNGMDMVLSIGTGFIWIINSGKNILSGDYLCSGNIAGYAVKQEENILYNYTVAKAIENVIWKKNEKKRLISCTYHGG